MCLPCAHPLCALARSTCGARVPASALWTLINVGPVARTIDVAAPVIRGTGSLSLLRATSLSATGGATLAGQRLSPRTGQLAGTPSLTPVRPSAHGVYAVRVPAHAAAILMLAG